MTRYTERRKIFILETAFQITQKHQHNAYQRHTFKGQQCGVGGGVAMGDSGCEQRDALAAPVNSSVGTDRQKELATQHVNRQQQRCKYCTDKQLREKV